MRFSGKHVVVTGAASGLGLAIAKAAEAEGATITAIDRVASTFENSRICDIADEDQVSARLSGLPRIERWSTAPASRGAPRSMRPDGGF